MNLLVVSEQPGQSSPYIKAACKVGWRIACESNYEQLPSVLTGVQAEAAVLIARQVGDHRSREQHRARNVRPVCFVEMRTTAVSRVTKERARDAIAQVRTDRLPDRASSCPMPTAVRPSSSADRRGHALARAKRMCVLA